MDDDDDFWTTYIALTPEQDRHFAGCGKWLLILAGMILAWLVAVVALGSPVQVVNGGTFGSGTVTTQGVLTCAHLFRKLDSPAVRVGNRFLPARIIAIDWEHDLALLDVETGLKPTPIGTRAPSGPVTFQGVSSTTGMVPGDSGGAVLRNGVLVGVHWGYRGREVLYVDCVTVRKFLSASARTNGTLD
jgi:hypothetical protein